VIIEGKPKKLKKAKKPRVKKVKPLKVTQAKVAPSPVSVQSVVIQGTTPAEIPAVPQVIDFKYGMVTGPAGSGKTHRIRKILETDESWGLVTATTGAAARVLGPKVPTVNSALGFFDQQSLERVNADGTLRKNIRTLRTKYERLIIDEASMLSAEMFDLILPACEAEDMGLILVGDFLQLPPITKDFKAPHWLFQSKHWARFTQGGKNTTRLQTQYRHNNADFVKGLNHLRAGKGEQALPHLQKAGVTFPPVPTVGSHDDFDGVVIVATNEAKDIIDNKRYAAIEAEEVTYNTERWGNRRKEWDEIADAVSLKVGCRVMILRNLYEEMDGKTTLTQANGETGEVLNLNPAFVTVRRDDGSVVNVAMQKTDNAVRRTILNQDHSRLTETIQAATGGVEYLPLCRAFAMTTHKCQGLTITTKTQMGIWRDNFWTHPAMIYVAASRVKNPEDLSIVGADMLWRDDKSLLEEKCKMDANCSQWV
jgi:ATP-dependent DNA helicase PIF1